MMEGMHCTWEPRLINDGWAFAKMPVGSTQEDLKEARWQAVDLPHDWLIWQADDLYESADVWYRRVLTREEAEAPVTLLRFDGVYMDCDVLLNGEVAASHAYGYTAFDADLTGRIREGDNLLLVHIRHRSPNTRWYSGSGIFRDVTLCRLPERHLVPDGLYIIPREKDGGWVISVRAETTGEGELSCSLAEADGTVVARGSARAENNRAEVVLRLAGGRLWSPEEPYLYTMTWRFAEQAGSVRVGLRTTRFDPATGFWLNGRRTKLRGVCLHQDLGCLGSAFHEKAARRQLRVMKEMGVNALRTSHNPPAARLLALCDEMGILVDDEAFDMWERSKTTWDYARFFPEKEAEDVAAWVRRDRNHPCVVLWSIGNEISEMHAGPRGEELTRMLMEQVHQHDPERNAEVTFGCNYMPWQGGQRCADIVKIPGYNYGEKLYEAHHAAHPDWVIYGSETGSILSTRGVYHFPADRNILSDADLQCSSLGNSVTSWGTRDLRNCIVDDLNQPFSMGQFIWSGIDYIGEPTPYHTRSCYFGHADTACFPKDSYYLFQSLWTDRKMIHIGVSWDWNEGQQIDVRVMTNCAQAELLVNGESLGRQAIDSRDPAHCLAMWRLPFRPGELLAIGLDAQGREICRASRKTPGDTARLCLRAEDPELLGDGDDLTFITVTAEDEKGVEVDNARDRVFVRVSGGGRLMGMDNGDPTDEDGYKVSARRLFNGKLLLMVGSNGLAEDAVITVCSTSGLRAELVLPVRPAARKAGTSCVQLIPPAGEAAGPVPVRRLELLAPEGTEITPARPEIAFGWRVHPENADPGKLCFQITNASGIVSPCARAEVRGDRVYVRGLGDGELLLRGLCGNAKDHPEQISQMEIRVRGMGHLGLDPYTFVSAGLYDFSAGEVGAGNEQGIAFDPEGWSMVGFRGVEFGRAGSDTLTLPVFTLDGNPYDIEMYLGDPRGGGRLLTKLHYQKPSVWNTYLEETWQLPEVLTGTQTICFALQHKIHVKGFRFAKQSRAFRPQRASEADSIYGDSFERREDAVLDIGNNVTLTWEEMDFGTQSAAELTVDGHTALDSNAITLRMENEAGDAVDEVINFRGGERGEQSFRIAVPGGVTRLSFVFLPGSRFDFYGFRFTP